MENIFGKILVTGYNLADGILFCFLFCAVVTLSATAVDMPFDMEITKLTDTTPNSMTCEIIVILIGAFIALIGSTGYNTVSKANNWMFLVIVLAFAACGIGALNKLSVHNFADIWNSLGEESNPFHRQLKNTFWHVVIWSWFANACMHACRHIRFIRFPFCKKGKCQLVHRCRNVCGPLYGMDSRSIFVCGISKIFRSTNYSIQWRNFTRSLWAVD